MTAEAQILSSLSPNVVVGDPVVTSGRNSGEIESEFHYQLCKTNPILSAVGGLQMNVSIFSQMAYENKSNWTLGENKPKQTQSKPILERMNVNFYATAYYDSKPTFAIRKGRPNNPNIEFTIAFSDGARFINQADKIALKIYPFGIDYPIVCEERLF
jgi:hypothetical protein